MLSKLHHFSEPHFSSPIRSFLIFTSLWSGNRINVESKFRLQISGSKLFLVCVNLFSSTVRIYVKLWDTLKYGLLCILQVLLSSSVCWLMPCVSGMKLDMEWIECEFLINWFLVGKFFHLRYFHYSSSSNSMSLCLYFLYKFVQTCINRWHN